MTFGQSDEENFRNLTGENWGKLEATVGREAYEADIALKKKHTELLEAQRQHGMAQGVVDIEMSQAAIRFRDQQADFWNKITALVYFIAVAAIPGSLAVVVWLWRWALGYA